LQATRNDNTVVADEEHLGGVNMRNNPMWLHLRKPTFFALAISLYAQQTAPTSGSIPAPTIRVTTHMVLVDAVVTDKQGNPITGLRPEDFIVEENGKAQKVSSLTTPAETMPAVANPLPPGIYSNETQYRSPGKPITVMLLDALNTPFSDQAYARRQMLAFVKEQMKPTDRMAVFTLTGSLNVLQDFTSDPQILYTALQRYRPQTQQFASGAPPTASAEPGAATAGSTVASLDASTPPPSDAGSSLGAPRGQGAPSSTLITSAQEALQAFEGTQIAYAKDQWAVMTLNALNSLARIMGGLPGRKNLIWVTGDLPFSFIPEDRVMTEAELSEDLPSLNTRRVDEHSAGNYAATFRQSHAEEIREVAARFASAQVAVYPVDARGLSISTDIDSQETMREMARETGGRAYVNQNEIKMGVQRAFQDEYAAYTIGYYPENKKYDGKYRSIKVKVKRDGVEIQSRKGYFAIDPSQVKGYNAKQEVISALGDFLPSTMVSFKAQVKPPSANSAPGKVGVTYLVDANTLSVEDTSGGKHINADFYANIYSGGKLVASAGKKIDQVFDASTYQKILQNGLATHLDLDPAPGQLRLAVQDARTGMVGTINVASF
jgi:VWFA-related protein